MYPLSVCNETIHDQKFSSGILGKQSAVFQVEMWKCPLLSTSEHCITEKWQLSAGHTSFLQVWMYHLTPAAENAQQKVPDIRLCFTCRGLFVRAQLVVWKIPLLFVSARLEPGLTGLHTGKHLCVLDFRSSVLAPTQTSSLLLGHLRTQEDLLTVPLPEAFPRFFERTFPQDKAFPYCTLLFPVQCLWQGFQRSALKHIVTFQK